MWQGVQFSEQTRLSDTLVCCWGVNQPTTTTSSNNNSNNNKEINVTVPLLTLCCTDCPHYVFASAVRLAQDNRSLFFHVTLSTGTCRSHYTSVSSCSSSPTYDPLSLTPSSETTNVQLHLASRDFSANFSIFFSFVFCDTVTNLLP